MYVYSRDGRGETFSGGESGVAVPSTVCSPRSVGISVDLNTYEPHLLAGTMAHMIGHNIGMSHDDGSQYIMHLSILIFWHNNQISCASRRIISFSVILFLKFPVKKI